MKDYRVEGPGRYTTMTLAIGEFIRRFLLHVLPTGFRRIRHYGLFASGKRAETIARARELLGLAPPAAEGAVEIDPGAAQVLAHPCPRCGGRMIVIETFEAGCQPRLPLSGWTLHESRPRSPRQSRQPGSPLLIDRPR